jgi:hypothetical protein
LAEGHHISAMTLVRPAYEALVRAIWCLNGASEEWINQFVSADADRANGPGETIKGPPLDSMLDTIAKHHPQWVHDSLTVFKDATWLPMHSYVHGGIRPVIQTISGCPDHLKVNVILNGNGFVLMAINAMLIAGGERERIKQLQPVQKRHVSSLPPMTPV